METTKCSGESAWISFFLRLAVASLFGAAAIDKFLGGLNGTLVYFHTLFAATWLPEGVVTIQAYIAPWMELLITCWLLTGFRLRAAWVVATFFMISLAFGTMVASQYQIAANNYFFVLLCLLGLYFSPFDRFNFDSFLSKSK